MRGKVPAGPFSGNRNFRKPQGFTLVEILVVIAIVAVIAAFTFSAMSSARDRANTTVEINTLRQLGLAQHLYQESTGKEVYSVKALVDTGHFPVGLAASPADPVREGKANEVFDRMNLGTTIAEGRLPFRCSILTRATFGYHYDVNPYKPSRGQNFGWAVMASRLPLRRGKLTFSEGTYLRLLNDGSVVFRRPVIADYNGFPATSPVWLFIDYNDEERAEDMKDPE